MSPAGSNVATSKFSQVRPLVRIILFSSVSLNIRCNCDHVPCSYVHDCHGSALSWRDILMEAGSRRRRVTRWLLTRHHAEYSAVCSLLGVILIARPTFLFGSAAGSSGLLSSSEGVADVPSGYTDVSAAQRIGAVG